MNKLPSESGLVQTAWILLLWGRMFSEKESTSFCMCLEILTPLQCQNCFPWLCKQAELTKEEVRSGRRRANSVLLFSSLFWQISFKKYLNSSPLCIPQKSYCKTKSLKVRWITPVFWYSCNPLILHKLILWK